MSTDLSSLSAVNLLLGSLPTRKQMMKNHDFTIDRTITIRVERSSPFEFISSVMSPFLGIWGSNFTITYSDYDPSLTNITAEKDADLYILWLDWRVYLKSMNAETAANWLAERIDSLRNITDKPILINNWLEAPEMGDILWSPETSNKGWIRELNMLLSNITRQKAGCAIIDLASIAGDFDGNFYDSRNEEVSNYPFSDQASIAIARHLGVHLLPAVLLPRLKALALDLDDTLYNGVLGEEGIEGVKCTPGHLQLHKLLLRLKQSGILLTICSRNEEADVKDLFNTRKDFPLQWDDFAAVSANWLPKADNINVLAQQLNIDPSAFLFIDDNPAELLKMAEIMPHVRLLLADPNGNETVKRISHYPALYQLRTDDSAVMRTIDIQANQVREQLKHNAVDYTSYLDSLQMVVRMFENNTAHIRRLYELSQKTNQFNVALRRLSEIEAEQSITRDHIVTYTVQLTDTLTDSGIIGAFVCQLDEETAEFIEIIFSCRALGREIETVAFAYVVEKLLHRGISAIRISVKEGPRNTPAREWLTRFVKDTAEPIAAAELLAVVKASCFNHPAKVEESI